MTTAIALLPFLAFCWRRLLRYLHVFQQEDYDGGRFLAWLVHKLAFDRRLSAAVLLLVGASLLFPSFAPGWAWELPVALSFAVFALLEGDPRKAAKKKLVLTSRATRIGALAFLLCAIAALAAHAAFGVFGWVLAIQAVPVLMVLANTMLSPYEAWTQRKYWREAEARLKQIDPKIVGITGSFGKTSVKHFLGHILELDSGAAITPGSVNSPMGIARYIREQLKAGSRSFVVEMGAYGIGSIRRCCALTPPQYGIITAIGEAHYERFKSLAAVAQAKFELAEEVLKQPGGTIVVHESVLDQPYAANFIRGARSRFVICGAGKESDVLIGDIDISREGAAIPIVWKGRDYRLFAPVLGRHQATNIVLAFVMAVTLGVSPERAIFALRTAPQVKHRLELKSRANGALLLDDSYNSNPAGFISALELISKIRNPGGRAILVTPGMVEMGNRHDDLHRQIGAAAAHNVDIALVIRADRIPTFVDGYKSQNGKTILDFASYNDADKWLTANSQTSDVILVENDLPDLYEREFRT
ncbi:MAG: UDP-N-acetylmuramoyl-tripeptide--D-alanyl-D-alanine ligase [Rhodomicrobium sp.]